MPASLCEALFDAISSSLDALERVGALDYRELAKERRYSAVIGPSGQIVITFHGGAARIE
ncbi:hypothetical protein [Lysobacter sp. CA199]|uniref:hypothetical protein n=1 Tax=Lysobacter sp. CA199 TaxID=3455608 RepID=UPI003F8D1F2D